MKKLSLRVFLSLRGANRRSNLHSGVSLIIAIIFVAALMLVMAGLFEVRIRVIQALGNRETESKAQYLAQSAEELANFWAATHGVGRNTADEDGTPERIAAMAAFLAPLFTAASDVGITNCADTDGIAGNGPPMPCVGIAVVNRAANAEKVSFGGADYFSAPIRGSGDAAEYGVDCSGAPADADNSCHWNRMYLGQIVEVPLYYENMDGSVTKLGFGAGFPEEFRLRVRTPACAAGSAGCSADGRLILYPSVTAPVGGENPDYRNPDRDPVLVQWSVFDGGGGGVVTAWDETAGGRRRMTADQWQNTEISAGRINLANSLPIPGLENQDRLEDFAILKYLNASGNAYDQHSGKKASDKQRQSISEAINAYSKPMLRLSLVGQPQRNNSALGFRPFEYPADLNEREEFDIPYLEYQLLTKNSPSSDTGTLVIGWAEIGGFRKEFKKYIKRSTSASGFAIESF